MIPTGYINFDKVDISQLSQIISQTPWWVWVLFIYLLNIYIKNLETKIVYIPKLLIIPIILTMAIMFKIFNTYSSPYLPYYITYTIMGAIIGLIIGFISSKPPLKLLKNINSVEIPGSFIPLIIFLIFFTNKYIFGFLQANNPILVEKYSYIENIITGIFFGFSLARSSFYFYTSHESKI